jgi:hypothetical protein
MSKETTYNIWQAMISRCENVNNPAYANYGGRGISVYTPWRESFEAFLKCLGHRPDGMTLERIDNSKGYQPGNVKWATRLEQGANKRNNVRVVYNGELVNVAEAARRSGKKAGCLRRRIQLGWPAERLFT